MGKPIIPLENIDYTPLKSRKIALKTCEKWKYGVTEYKGKTWQVASYFNDHGQVVFQKLRDKDKNFLSLGDKEQLTFYGKWLWREGGKRVVITEGEIDALSMSQVQELKWPVLSIPTGVSSAKKMFQREVEYLEKFDEVIIMFDSDEVGQEAAIECAQVLSPNKAKIASLPLKDPNEMLKEDRVTELVQAMWDAKVYRMDGVLGVEDLVERLQRDPEKGLSYPWESLTKMTYGIRPSELIGLGAGTGMGKTEVFKEIACHLIKEHGQKVGMVMLEETPEHTLKGVLGKWASKRFHIPNGGWTKDELEKTVSAFTSVQSLFLYDHFGHTDYETIKSTLRYLAVGCGCKFLFLEPPIKEA